MAIVFDWYENPNASSEEEAALHPRILCFYPSHFMSLTFS